MDLEGALLHSLPWPLWPPGSYIPERGTNEQFSPAETQQKHRRNNAKQNADVYKD